MSEITPNTSNPVREDAYVEELAEKLGIDPQYIPKSPVWRNEEEIRAIAEMFANMSGGSSGGGVLVVVSEYDEQNNNSFLNMTAQELYDELQGGAIVVCKEVNANGGAWYYPLCEYTKIGNLFNFYFIYGNTNDYSVSTIQFQSTNADVRPHMM